MLHELLLLAPGPAVSLVCLSPGFGYIGCYVDSPNRVLPNYLRAISGNPSQCALAAAAAGYSYFGVQGTECFGGNSVQRAMSGGVSSGCAACSGDATQMCGGTWAVSLYGPGTERGTDPRHCTHVDGVCSLSITPLCSAQLCAAHTCVLLAFNAHGAKG